MDAIKKKIVVFPPAIYYLLISPKIHKNDTLLWEVPTQFLHHCELHVLTMSFIYYPRYAIRSISWKHSIISMCVSPLALGCIHSNWASSLQTDGNWPPPPQWSNWATIHQHIYQVWNWVHLGQTSWTTVKCHSGWCLLRVEFAKVLTFGVVGS